MLHKIFNNDKRLIHFEMYKPFEKNLREHSELLNYLSLLPFDPGEVRRSENLCLSGDKGKTFFHFPQ